MKLARSAAALCAAAMVLTAVKILAQYPPEIRRAQPAQEPPITRAQPVDTPPPLPPRVPTEPSEVPPAQTEGADRRQIDYANGLFTRKLYDLAIPEYQKYLDDFRGGPGTAKHYLSLGEWFCHPQRGSDARS